MRHNPLRTEPAPPACSDDLVVPNILHRVWLGRSAPPIESLVSLLTAVLLLAPTRIVHWATHRWTQSYGFNLGSRLHRSFDRLGVEMRYVDVANASDPFVAATSSFHVAFRMNSSLTALHLADIIRTFSVNSLGGVYLDHDAFVLSPDFARFRRCRAAVACDVMDGPAGGYYHDLMSRELPTPAPAA
eukprot:1311026-Prymnesium_polylepis.1